MITDSSRKDFNLVFEMLSQISYWRCCFVVAMSFVLEVRRDGKQKYIRLRKSNSQREPVKF